VVKVKLLKEIGSFLRDTYGRSPIQHMGHMNLFRFINLKSSTRHSWACF